MHNEELMGIRREEEMEMSDDDVDSSHADGKDLEDPGKTPPPPLSMRHPEPALGFRERLTGVSLRGHSSLVGLGRGTTGV